MPNTDDLFGQVWSSRTVDIQEIIFRTITSGGIFVPNYSSLTYVKEL